MKKSFLAAACFVSIICFSQNNSKVTFDLKDHLSKNKTDTTKPKVKLNRNTPVVMKNYSTLQRSYNSKPRLIGESKHGKVYALPQDNMPCIMPDMKLFNAMPNFADKNAKTIDPGILLKNKKTN